MMEYDEGREFTQRRLMGETGGIFRDLVKWRLA